MSHKDFSLSITYLYLPFDLSLTVSVSVKQSGDTLNHSWRGLPKRNENIYFFFFFILWSSISNSTSDRAGDSSQAWYLSKSQVEVLHPGNAVLNRLGYDLL